MKNQLKTDLAEVVSGLRQALALLELRIASDQMTLTILRGDRSLAIQHHVEALIPDLEPATLDSLQMIDEFVTELVPSVFAEAENLPVPLWIRMLGRAAPYRVNALKPKFDLVRVHLTSFIDRDTDNEQFDDVRLLSERISASVVSIKTLEQKRKELRARYDEASQSYDNLVEVGGRVLTTPQFAAYASSRAENLRTARKQAEAQLRTREPFDDGTSDTTDLLLWALADVPTSGRTLALDAVLHDHGHHEQAPVEMGGGSFGGAGATGSFDPDPTPVATDDSLGRYS